MNQKSNYDKTPSITVQGVKGGAFTGYPAIVRRIRSDIEARGPGRTVVVIDCYPGVREEELLPVFAEGLCPALTVTVSGAALAPAQVEEMIRRNLTDDRVFGVLSCRTIREFFDPEKLTALRSRIAAVREGVVLVYGTGAALAFPPDILVYADLARWEIQQRYRGGEIGNWLCDNKNEDILRKYKRGYFIDWRVIDRHKKDLFDRMDYVLDTNLKNNPRMITGEALRMGLCQAALRPFRVVPYFDPGVWGGQWIKEVCDMNRGAANYAWGFDCVPEENSLLLEVNGVTVELPAINLVFYQPQQLLGDRVHARFGTEFPIRFDFLDTMGGQNLSLQVHPLTEYIQETFGMHYTQDESYYILDADEAAEPVVYLGLKKPVRREETLKALENAQEGAPFDAAQYVNTIPVHKHDHLLIPAGTIHCSGSGTMVLEISATPYIFTFKLWDWGRLGLDGKPRPVHLEHGRRNIQFDRDTDWVLANLVGRVEPIGSGEGWIEERTGLHEREFIETRRHWFTGPVQHDTGGGVNVLNLVEGREAVVESPEGRFAPFVVHYAETFIVPAAVGRYTISPHGESLGQKLATIKAYVRT
jgi:mannose-6-phosphate isomerase class I